MHSRVLNVKASNGKRLQKDEERKKVKDPDSRARQMTEAVSLKEGKTQSSFKSDVWSFSGSAFIKKKT